MALTPTVPEFLSDWSVDRQFVMEPCGLGICVTLPTSPPTANATSPVGVPAPWPQPVSGGGLRPLKVALPLFPQDLAQPAQVGPDYNPAIVLDLRACKCFGIALTEAHRVDGIDAGVIGTVQLELVFANVSNNPAYINLNVYADYDNVVFVPGANVVQVIPVAAGRITRVFYTISLDPTQADSLVPHTYVITANWGAASVDFNLVMAAEVL